jgi:hypothetical protein
MIRVLLPAQPCSWASLGRQVELKMEGAASICTILDESKAHYPTLHGTIHDQVILKRAFIRHFTAGEDLSQRSASDPLPESGSMGEKPLRVIGTMAGG